MIVKIQTGLASNCEAPRILVYDRSRAFTYEGLASDEIIRRMDGRPKVYFEATITPGGLKIGDEVESQSW